MEKKRLSKFFDYKGLLDEVLPYLMNGWKVVKPLHTHWFYGYTIIIERKPDDLLSQRLDQPPSKECPP